MLKIKVSGIEKIIKKIKNKPKKLEKDIDNEVKNCAINILRDSKRICPVNTGALRRSGRFEKIREMAYKVSYGGAGTGVNYAKFVEFGTRYMMAQPYLMPSFRKNIHNLKRKLKSVKGW